MQPYYERAGITIYHGDCRDVLPQLAQCSFDYAVTDPPYGEQKAEWDNAFSLEWLPLAAKVTQRALAIMPGVSNLLAMPRSIPPFSYRWMLAVHLTNGMTRGSLGFGNWIPVVVYGREGISLARQQQDATDVAIGGIMPNHPSPKPEQAMRWILSRFTPGSVIDPFMGSGTTLLAAYHLGFSGIGIEREESYCEIAAKRLAQMPMLLEATA